MHPLNTLDYKRLAAAIYQDEEDRKILFAQFRELLNSYQTIAKMVIQIPISMGIHLVNKETMLLMEEVEKEVSDMGTSIRSMVEKLSKELFIPGVSCSKELSEILKEK